MGADLASRQPPDQRSRHPSREEGLLERVRPVGRLPVPSLLPLAGGDEARERALRRSRQRQRVEPRRPRRDPAHGRARAELHRADEGRPPSPQHRHRTDGGRRRRQPSRRPGRRPRRVSERPPARGRRRRHRPPCVRGGLRRLPERAPRAAEPKPEQHARRRRRTETTGCSGSISPMSRRRSPATRRFPRPPWAVRRTTSGRGLHVESQAPSSLERTR